MPNEHRDVHGTPRSDAVNAPRGQALASSPELELARYAVVGILRGTFHASNEARLDTVAELASRVSPELVAKTAVYCRAHGRMKDVAAFLVAVLAKRDVELMLRVFPRVIDDARMLRSFVGSVRSGVTGRRSFGSAPKRALREWFAARSPEAIFRQSIGQSPSMSDVIKMVRPPPRNDQGEADAVREALYGYLIGKSVDCSKLPPLARAFDAWKKDAKEPLPDVPFEMLTALPLRAEHWTELARKMTFGPLRQHLITLFRHGVFVDEDIAELVAQRLADPEAVARSRVLPYQLLAVRRAVETTLPRRIVDALGQAVEHAVANVPEVRGVVALCPDVSGSMHTPAGARRGGAASSVRCIDVAALVTAALLRKSEGAVVLPFSDDVVSLPRPLAALDRVVDNASMLSSLPSGGTSCAAPLRWLNERGESPDLVVFVSDNQSWADFRFVPPAACPPSGSRATSMAEEWERIRARNPRAKLVLVDLQPYATTHVAPRADVLHVAGFSDGVFEIVSSFLRDETDGRTFLQEIEAVTI